MNCQKCQYNLPYFVSGSRILFDDFREAYWWLRMNTPEDAKVMSWWDYGYQVNSSRQLTDYNGDPITGQIRCSSGLNKTI